VLAITLGGDHRPRPHATGARGSAQQRSVGNPLVLGPTVAGRPLRRRR
jgi:hypothetical protein